MPVVPLQIATADEILVAQLFAPQAPVPGAARELNSGALLMYDGRVGGPDAAGVVAHAFRLEFGTPNVAANWLWSRLHGHAAEVRFAGAEVRLHHAALKAAMLAAAGEPQPL